MLAPASSSRFESLIWALTALCEAKRWLATIQYKYIIEYLINEEYGIIAQGKKFSKKFINAQDEIVILTILIFFPELSSKKAQQRPYFF